MKPRASVPCNGCTACCRHDLIVLHPECGDDVASYDTYQMPHPFLPKVVYALKRRANGDCVYLGPQGCTIYERAPTICREFDCRKQYLMHSRAQRRELVAKGLYDKAVLEAGRQRVHTLERENELPAVR
jgi:uncharacterized protein